jgi:uncharacterized C2H2 Zn-finger protein
MFTQFFYEYSFYNSSPSQSRCTKFFNTRKNYGRIVERFCGPLTGRAGRKELWKNCRNIFGRSAGKIFLQFFHAPPFTLVRKQRFYGDFVEKL